MKLRGAQNERLDKVGQEMIEAAKMREDEIEGIVASPHLFRSIQANIERQRSMEDLRNKSLRRPWNWRLKMATGGALAIVIGVAVGVGSYMKIRLTETVKTPVTVYQTPDIVSGPRSYAPDPQVTSSRSTTQPSGPTVLKASYKKSTAAEPLRHRQELAEEVTEFYPLTYTDDQDTNVDGGQLVRVELPRSSLVAMGVDPPAGNDAPRVKTDLLIGSDGVMKAVRFVK